MVTSTNDLSVPTTMSLQLGPNPTRDFTWLRMSSEEQTQVNIRLIDLQGRLMGQWPALDLPAGMDIQQELNLSSLNLTNGIYLIQVQGDTFQWTEKLVVQRN